MRMNTKLASNILVDDICGTEPLTAANVGSLVVEVESEPRISPSSNSLCELAQRVIPEFGVEVAVVEIPVFDEAIDAVVAVVELLELDAIEILNTPELV
jgi:hydrogenase maturation factor